MTLVLSEKSVAGLLEMREVVASVDECFRRQGEGEAVNSPRTRSAVPGSVLNVMHASLPYLGRAGVKCYLGTKSGTRFVFVLFDLADATPLAVMGADLLGRYRTGAASAVATRHMSGMKEFAMAVYGSGRQALTQVMAMAEVASLSEVRVWSPNNAHRAAFAELLEKRGFTVTVADSPQDAGKGCDVGSAITSSREPFLDAGALARMRHLNLCGANSPGRSEATPDAISLFRTVAVDDLQQARVEQGDLGEAVRAGAFEWERAVELKYVVAGKVKPEGPTLFKSAGVAIEDVAVASMLYDKALKGSDYAGSPIDLGF